ncbi:hypothetical protein Tco_1261755, partial [Tanacetum coccineum]
MDVPPSPNQVLNFPSHDSSSSGEFDVKFEEDPQEEPEEEPEEDPQEEPEEESEEDPEEEIEVDAEEDASPAATSLAGSPITPPPLFEYSFDTEAVTPVVANRALKMPPPSSTFKVGGPSSVSPFPPFYLHRREIERLNDNTKILFNNVNYLERCKKECQAEMDANSFEICKVKRRMTDFNRELGHEVQFMAVVEGRVTKLEDKDQENMDKMEKRLEKLETNYALVLSDRDGWKKAFHNLQAWVSERLGWGVMDACPDDDVDGSAAFRESQPPKPQGPPNGSQIMPPKMLKRKAVKKIMIESCLPRCRRNCKCAGLFAQDFMNGKPHPFNGTDGVVGLRRWIKKVEQVFEICKYSEEDKVMFASSTFEGSALT